MLGCAFPVLAFSHCRDVVAAVSKAGGLGVLVFLLPYFSEGRFGRHRPPGRLGRARHGRKWLDTIGALAALTGTPTA